MKKLVFGLGLGEMDVAWEFENPYDSNEPFLHKINVNDAHDENLILIDNS